MTLNPVCDNVETKQGVPLTVTGVAQVTMNSFPKVYIRFGKVKNFSFVDF